MSRSTPVSSDPLPTKIVQAALGAQKPKLKVKIILHVNYDNDDTESATGRGGRTRGNQPELFELSTSTHYRRPKVYPSYTPWGDYWRFRDLNDSHPEKKFKRDHSDVPDFDLGEPLDETNFWEQPWITANEETKKVRDEREKKRKRQQRYGGLTAAGRKRAYKKRAGVMSMRKNGRFVKLAEN
jgi:hypothetical protein